MIRILLIGLLAYMAWRVIRNLRRSFPSIKRKPARPVVGEPKELVPCGGCGTFIVKSSAIRVDDKYYCSEMCRSK